MNIKSRSTAQAKMPKLLRRHNSKCRYCGRDVISVKQLKRQGRFIRDTHHWVFWSNGSGQEIQTLKATVDHVLDLSEGGSNKLDNLVLACVSCNAARSREKHQRAEHNKVCLRCGKPNNRRPKFCRRCYREIQEKWWANRPKVVDRSIRVF